MVDQLSAEIAARFSAGPPTQAQIVRVRDLVICVGEPSSGVSIEEVYAHPPIGWDRRPGMTAERAPGEFVDGVDLGGGITIEQLDRETAELVMNACTPRGHYFVPVRQFGQRYSLVKEVPLDELEHRHFAWDTDGTLDDALTLSRLVRDNGYSTQYAARLLDYEDGQRCVVYVLHREDAAIYRLDRGREWLDASEGRQLASLLAAYWECREELPPRVRRAMWRMAYAPRLRWADMVLPILIGGLEAMLKIGRYGLTEQFKKRAPALAAEVGIDGFGEDMAQRLYDGRSDWVHGSHVQLFAGPSPTVESPEEEAEEQPEGPQSSDEKDAFAEVALLMDVLRAAVRRAIEDAEFRQVFVADDEIAARWPA
jgi:hypothetical protein